MTIRRWDVHYNFKWLSGIGITRIALNVKIVIRWSRKWQNRHTLNHELTKFCRKFVGALYWLEKYILLPHLKYLIYSWTDHQTNNLCSMFFLSGWGEMDKIVVVENDVSFSLWLALTGWSNFYTSGWYGMWLAKICFLDAERTLSISRTLSSENDLQCGHISHLLDVEHL